MSVGRLKDTTTRHDSAMTDGVSRFRRTVPAAMRQRVTQQQQQLVMLHVTRCHMAPSSDGQTHHRLRHIRCDSLYRRGIRPHRAEVSRGRLRQTALYCKLLASTGISRTGEATSRRQSAACTAYVRLLLTKRIRRWPRRTPTNEDATAS